MRWLSELGFPFICDSALFLNKLLIVTVDQLPGQQLPLNREIGSDLRPDIYSKKPAQFLGSRQLKKLILCCVVLQMGKTDSPH